MRHHEAKTGDKVRLKIGEREMIVVAYSSAGRVCCKWIDEASGRPVTGWFDAGDLVPVEPETKPAQPTATPPRDTMPGFWRPAR